MLTTWHSHNIILFKHFSFMASQINELIVWTLNWNIFYSLDFNLKFLKKLNLISSCKLWDSINIIYPKILIPLSEVACRWWIWIVCNHVGLFYIYFLSNTLFSCLFSFQVVIGHMTINRKISSLVSQHGKDNN